MSIVAYANGANRHMPGGDHACTLLVANNPPVEQHEREVLRRYIRIADPSTPLAREVDVNWWNAILI